MDAAIAQAIVGLVMAVISLLVSAAKAFKFVQEGERGIKLFCGQYVRVVEPGFVLLIPWINSLPRMHVRDRPRDVPPQVITLKDKLSFRVSALIVFHVTDPYKAMFGVDDIDGAMKMTAASILREQLAVLEYEEASNFESLRDKLNEELKVRSEQWGVEVTRFAVTDFAPTPETASILVSVAEAGKLVEGNAIVLTSLEELAKKLKEVTGQQHVEGLLSAFLLRRSAQPVATFSSDSTNSNNGAIHVVRDVEEDQE